MDPTVLLYLIILVLSVIAAALSWRSVASYLCFVIAAICLVALLPGGPW